MNAFLADEVRPRTSPVGDGVLLTFCGVNLNENARPEDMVSIRPWIDPHRIISLQRRRLKVVGDLAANIEAGQGLVDYLKLLLWLPFC